MKLICFAEHAPPGPVAAPQLTESSRPAAASGYARYQKPISLVLPCVLTTGATRAKRTAKRRIKHRATAAYIITDRLIISLCVYIAPDGTPAVAGVARYTRAAMYEKQNLFVRLSTPRRQSNNSHAWMRCSEYCTTRVINRCSFVRNNTDESAVSTGITVDNNQLMPQRKEQGPGSVRQSVMTCVWVKCKQRDTLRRLCHVRQAIDQQLDQTKFGLNLYAKSITSN